MTRKGRTWRRRGKKLDNRTPSKLDGISRTEINMRKWMKKNYGYSPQYLKPAYFADTGRGLMTLRKLMSGDLILAIPKGLLITTFTVMEDDMGAHLKRWKSKFGATQVLSLFLLYEWIKGPLSKWNPYITMLPQSYTNAAYWTEYELQSLPSHLIPQANEQVQQLKQSYEEIKEFSEYYEGISERRWCKCALGNDLPNFGSSDIPNTTEEKIMNSTRDTVLCDRNHMYHGSSQDAVTDSLWQCKRHGLTFELYRWAWSSVNTRCVYMRPSGNPWIRDPKQDCMALAPFLDLLNHSAEVQVAAGFNESTGYYEIRTETLTPKYSQAFISYGPHNNGRLLLEYGFTVPNNPHNTVPVNWDHIFAVCERVGCVNMDNKVKLITDNDLQKGLLLSVEGLSWNLEIILRILALDVDRMNNMRKILSGDVFSGDNERFKHQLANHILADMAQEMERKIQVYSGGDSEKQQMAVGLCQEDLGIILHCRKLLLDT